MSFRGWNTDWAITRGMRCSVMFIRVKTSSTEEGMMAFTRAPLCTSLRRVTAQTREPELIAAARVNACVGFIPARFWTVPEAALRGVYTAISHTTSKTVKTPFIINVLLKYTCVPDRKTRTKTIRYEYVYRYTPNIYIYTHTYRIWIYNIWNIFVLMYQTILLFWGVSYRSCSVI